jgi:hypothetical protein
MFFTGIRAGLHSNAENCETSLVHPRKVITRPQTQANELPPKGEFRAVKRVKQQ